MFKTKFEREMYFMNTEIHSNVMNMVRTPMYLLSYDLDIAIMEELYDF